MKLDKFICYIESLVPVEMQEEWDHSGIQIGDKDQEIKRILLALDVDDDCIQEAIKKKVDLIFTHHPFLFHKISEITTATKKGQQIYELIKENIAVYSAHTNLDKVRGGVNDTLAEKLELRDIQLLEPSETFPGNGLGRIGYTKYKEPLHFIEHVKKQLSLDHVIVYGPLDRKIDKVCVMGGSGASFIDLAAQKGCDALITSDIKYHDADDAMDQNLLLFDVGHYESERDVLVTLKEMLEQGSFEVQIFYRKKPTRNIY